jgi:hypothetical protein
MLTKIATAKSITISLVLELRLMASICRDDIMIIKNHSARTTTSSEDAKIGAKTQLIDQSKDNNCKLHHRP